MGEDPVDAFGALPDPAEAESLDDLIERLRLLKVWAGDPSYETIKHRVNAAWTEQGRPAGELTRRSTVANCFTSGRRRLNVDLLLAVVEALHPDTGYVTQWRQALRVIGRETEAVSQVRVQDTLPQDLAGFTGRTGELDRLRLAGGAVVIEGMAGVGKTQLAVHAGHLLIRANALDRALFVNLRGFHPEGPADPAAVLDGFLRLLGMPGSQIPHELTARTAAYRGRLAGTRALVVLDNAATVEQVRPLLPETPGCLALVTSRRSLRPLTHLAVDLFTPAEAEAFLAGALPGVPAGTDPDAAARIAERCGYLPLALSLIAGHIRGVPGWTLTDHADRLDERHRGRQLDSGVELALDLSYQHLPADQQRLLRLAALHPGQDFDAYAAAALAGTDLATVQSRLDHLCRDHLLQPGRYTFHDLVRAFATSRAHDEDPPPERSAALTRLFDHYLATAAAAMNTLHPAEAHRRPQAPPATTPSPDLTDPDAAIRWLDTERPTLVAVAARGPGHAGPLAQTLSRYLAGGHHGDALTMHGHALQAARDGGDLAGQARALIDIGYANLRLGRLGPAAEHCRQALDLYRQTGDRPGQARTLTTLGIIAERSGHYPAGIDYKRQSLDLYRQAGDRTGEGLALGGLGFAMVRSGRYPEAVDYCEQALALARQTENGQIEAYALTGLGDAEAHAGRYGPAGDHLRQALTRYRQLGQRTGEAGVLDCLGMLHTRLGRPEQAAEYHRQSLAIVRDFGDRDNEAWVLNGLGEAAHAAGRADDALAHHTAALTIATDIGTRDQQARAHAGLGHAHHALGDPDRAREHYRLALAEYTRLGVPEADRIRARLTGP